MKEEELFRLRKNEIRKGLLKYTRKAFGILPKIEKPRILDIGCGSGISTLELARLSKGEIIGIDIDQSALDEFVQNIKIAGLTSRVQAVNHSLFDIDFPDRSFDIIWSEGSIYAIGFKKGLQKWKRFLKPYGFMVVHDEKGNVSKKVEQIQKCNYTLLDYFVLSQETWWSEYFAPLEQLIAEYRTILTTPQLPKGLRQAQGELDMFKRHPERNSSVCFILKNA
ncbi:MAG TPA: class I SAM-dependent methyltransferase [Dehalococcoidia bacterium]|nr:class I SAM-dependent methyltransferase [Dehalococcoidia bacterium]